MVLADRTYDNEENHCNDDDNDDNDDYTKHMIHDDHSICGAAWPKPVRITLFHRILISEGSQISLTGQQIW